MEFEAQLKSRAQPLEALVPYLAINKFANKPALKEELIGKRLREYSTKPHQFAIRTGPVNSPVWFLYANLPWDSNFFKMRMARLHAVLFEEYITPTILIRAIKEFNHLLATNQITHCYCEVAAKDPQLFYALGQTGWSLVESRLQYYRATLDQLDIPRYKVRAVHLDEVEVLRAIAANNSNPFDRFHADPVFLPEQANAFLGEYAVAAARELCDLVLVPDDIIVDSFLAVSYLNVDAQVLNDKIGRVVLAAVGPQNRGWHRRLLSETLWHVGQLGGEAVLMTTQATNGAVVHNAQQLGFQLGGITHIFSHQPII